MTPRLWIAAAALLGAIGTFIWFESRDPADEGGERTVAADRAPGGGETPDDDSGTAGPQPSDFLSLEGLLAHRDSIDPVRYVEALLRLAQSPAVDDELIAAYARLAGNPAAEEARRAILDALLSRTPASAAFTLALKALAGDDTEPEDDPHWEFALDRCVELLGEGGVRPWVGDVLLMKPNVRSRRFVATSLMRHGATVEEEERFAITQDLIDAFHDAKSGTPGDLALRQEIIDGIGALAGDKVAAALEDPDDPELDADEEAEDAADTLEVVTALLERVRRNDLELIEFEEIVGALKILDPRALSLVEGSAPILETSAEARQLLEQAKSGG